MPKRNIESARFIARLDRCCARMNSGLACVALVLAAATLFLSLARIADDVAHDARLGRLPFIEMSTDGPDTGMAAMTD